MSKSKFDGMTLEELKVTAGIYGVTGDTTESLIEGLEALEGNKTASSPEKTKETVNVPEKPAVKEDNSELEKLRAENEGLKVDIASVVEECNDLEKQIEELRAENKEQNERIKNLVHETEDLEKNKSACHDCATCKYDIRTIQARKKELESEKVKSQKKICDLDIELKEINELLK